MSERLTEHFCGGDKIGCRCREYNEARERAKRAAEEDLRDLSSGDYYTFSSAELDKRLAAAEARGAQAVRERVEALADDMDERGKPGTRDSEMDCWSRRQIREDVKRLRAALSDPGTSSEEGRDA